MRIPFSIPGTVPGCWDVVGFGLNSIDLVAVVGEYPPSDTKQRMQRFARRPGGQIATATAVCAKLGLKARYVGSFGDDDFGRESSDSLRALGVSLEGSRTVPGATNQFAFVIVDGRTGGRTVLWDRHPDLAFEPADVPADAVTSGRMLVVDCHDTAAAARAAQYARAAGIPTIVDVERVRPGIGDLLRHIDAIIAAESFPFELTGIDEHGRALEKMAVEFGAPFVCVTLGAKGSLGLCRGREIRTPAFAVNCIDSTGAGDAFRGGFAAGCLRGLEEIEDVLCYATAVAGLNCRALGARGGLPTAAEVDALLTGARGSTA